MTEIDSKINKKAFLHLFFFILKVCHRISLTMRIRLTLQVEMEFSHTKIHKTVKFFLLFFGDRRIKILQNYEKKL